MATESTFVAAGIIVLAVAVAIVAAPWLQADMRRTVERANDNTPPDMTAIALMVFGATLVLGAPLSAGLLWATWL